MRSRSPEPGRNAGQPAVALIGARGHVDRRGERLGEALEAAVIAPGLGEFVQAALGRLRSGRAGPKSTGES